MQSILSLDDQLAAEQQKHIKQAAAQGAAEARARELEAQRSAKERAQAMEQAAKVKAAAKAARAKAEREKKEAFAANVARKRQASVAQLGIATSLSPQPSRDDQHQLGGGGAAGQGGSV